MKKIWLFVLFLFGSCTGMMADQDAYDITGYWTTFDEKTQKPRSIVAVYQFDSKYYARIVATYNDEGIMEQTLENPSYRAAGVAGDPFYCGLDFIWNLKRKGTGFESGKIMDPRNGNVYGCEMWKNGNDLILRGKYLVFGKNITWTRADESIFLSGFKKLDLKTLVPKIPKAK